MYKTKINIMFFLLIPFTTPTTRQPSKREREKAFDRFHQNNRVWVMIFLFYNPPT